MEKSFKKLNAPHGKFGVLGNHDHWMSAEKIRKIFKNSGIIDLSNDVVTLKKDKDLLNICGDTLRVFLAEPMAPPTF